MRIFQQTEHLVQKTGINSAHKPDFQRNATGKRFDHWFDYSKNHNRQGLKFKELVSSKGKSGYRLGDDMVGVFVV